MSGPASSGNLQANRSSTQESRQAAAQQRQAGRSETRESRQDAAQQRQESRQDWADDYHDYGYRGYYRPGGAYAAGLVVGATLTAAAFSAQASSCQTVINGLTYYQCGSTWYQPSMQASQVTYIVVNPPN